MHGSYLMGLALLGEGAHDAASAAIGERIAWLGLVAVLPLSSHFALAYRVPLPRPRVLAIQYGAAAVLAVLDALAPLDAFRS